MERHPEGGWYRESWRSPVESGGRALATCIYFLLESGQRSHWHRVDASEIWLWHAGAALRLGISETDTGPSSSRILGPDVLTGQDPQIVIPSGWWQAAEPAPGEATGWTLVSCVVAPGFEFSGFRLAPAGWMPG